MYWLLCCDCFQITPDLVGAMSKSDWQKVGIDWNSLKGMLVRQLSTNRVIPGLIYEGNKPKYYIKKEAIEEPPIKRNSCSSRCVYQNTFSTHVRIWNRKAHRYITGWSAGPDQSSPRSAPKHGWEYVARTPFIQVSVVLTLCQPWSYLLYSL